MDFVKFPKIARINRDCVITEKLDGTNAQICITEDGEFLVGSRSHWITPENDNYGFARWAYENKEELLKLGVGSHFGEWWGQGIQRRYDMDRKVFSLFNVNKWTDDAVRPACCSVVPILYTGAFDTSVINGVLLKLKVTGSIASKGFTNPEGIIIFHTHGRRLYKQTFDDKHKGEM